MARKAEIKWEGFTHGEDSYTAAYDPTSMANGYSATLANVEPMAGRLKPRLGSRKIIQLRDVWWMGEYQKALGGTTLAVDSGDLVVIGAGGGASTLLAGWIDRPRKISTVRVGKYLIILTDSPGDSLVAYEDAGFMKVFSAYMRNDFPAILSTASKGYGVEGGASYAWNSPATIGFVDPVTSTGNFEVSSPRNFAFTWVRLDREGDFTMADGMPGAQLESYEKVASRVQLNYIRYAVGGVGSGGIKGDISLRLDPGTAPAGATHLRIYMTLPGVIANGDYVAAQQIADVLVYRWAADVAIAGMPEASLGREYFIQGNDGMLAGSVNLLWSTGRDDLPPGGSVKFFDGRLWVYGGSTESNPGRSYFSAPIDGSTEQLSRLLSFNYSTDFKDTSTDETEPGVGMGISHGLLVFFNRRSVYAVQGADYTPEAIDVTRGAIGGITEIGQRIFYLSQEGPAVVAGSTIDDVANFKSDMVRPGLTNFSAFFDLGAEINGMWHNDSWILSDGRKAACFLMRNGSNGTWRIEPGEPMSFACASYPRKGELWVGGGDKPIYSLMERGSVRDGDTPFLCRVATNATNVPKGMISGEAAQVWTQTRWTDNSQLKISVNGDHGRVADLYEFVDDTAPGASAGYVQGQRGDVMQVIRAGALSHWFQIELQKYAWNSDILFGPIRLEIIPRNWHPEGISVSDPGRAEPILDAGLLTWDPETTEL